MFGSSTDQDGGKRRRGTSLRVRQQAQSGCVFESRIIQECADSTIDPLLLSLADYASFGRQSAFMAIRAADALSLIGKIASMSSAHCMAAGRE